MEKNTTGWSLADFDTAGWEDLLPVEGARVVSVCGPYGDELWGRIVKEVATVWGTHWVVAMDDGSEKRMSQLTGRALAWPYKSEDGEVDSDSDGDISRCVVAQHETRGIGWYVARVALNYMPMPGRS